MKLSLGLLPSLLNAQSNALAQQQTTVEAMQLITDSRQRARNGLFIAIAGTRVDGHDFLCKAKENGAVAALVTRFVDGVDIAQFKVTDTIKAIAAIATWARQQSTAKVIGITGSNGKTTTKAMLSNILERYGSVSVTQGNQNNEIGVPLTLCNADEHADYWVVEMGAAKRDDIAYLMTMASPDVGAITSIGKAHIGRFGSEENLVYTKAAIYRDLHDSAVAVINTDIKYAEQWLHARKAKPSLVFSPSGQYKSSQLWAESIKHHVGSLQFTLCTASQSMPVSMPVSGLHNVGNALCAAACALALHVPLTTIQQGLQMFSGVQGRLTIKRSYDNGWIIDDSYNANVESTLAAIDVLSQYAANKIMVLGQMNELGDYTQAGHEQVGDYAAEHVDQLITFGVDARFAQVTFDSKVSKPSRHFDALPALIRYMKTLNLASAAVLVKGSRSNGLEQLVAALAQPE